ncbi:hypothetical protein FRC00_005157 [Tulasnella sp. 408]|nr:hypothetical protein FRC00_005157 [Tulasnella sp. 408]
MAHSDEGKREKGYQCFADDLRRCEQLGLALCNFQYAGTKNVVGAAFQDLADIIKLVEDKTKIGLSQGDASQRLKDPVSIKQRPPRESWDSFRNIVNDPRTKGIPLVLETPGFDCETVWRKEVDVLNRISARPTRPTGVSDEDCQEEVVVEEIRQTIGAAEEAGYGAKGKVPKGRTSQGKAAKGKKRKKSGRVEEDGEDNEDDDMSEDG